MLGTNTTKKYVGLVYLDTGTNEPGSHLVLCELFNRPKTREEVERDWETEGNPPDLQIIAMISEEDLSRHKGSVVTAVYALLSVDEFHPVFSELVRQAFLAGVRFEKETGASRGYGLH